MQASFTLSQTLEDRFSHDMAYIGLGYDNRQGGIVHNTDIRGASSPGSSQLLQNDIGRLMTRPTK